MAVEDGWKNLRNFKGTQYMHKDGENKRVAIEDIEKFQDQGWKMGMVPRTQEENNRIIQKTRKTCLQKYGKESPTQVKENQDKRKETCREKYNSDSYLASEVGKKKIKETCLEKYGVEYQINSQQTRSKITHTFQEKYGVDSPFELQEIQDKCRETCFNRYGVTNVFQIPEVKAKCNTPEVNKKRFETKKRNGTCNSSQNEEDFYKMLCNTYGEENIIRNYIDNERYPYHCDFYIVSTDTFIELNLFWTHGPYPFQNSEEDQELLKKWQEKAETSSFYKNCIKVWTEKDVEKLNIARKNNLNYIRYYFNEKRGYVIYDLWD